MDRLHAGQEPAREDVAGGVIDQHQEPARQPAAKQSRLDRAERRVLVAHVVVLQLLQLQQDRAIQRRADLGVALLLRAQEVDQERRQDDQERHQHQARQRNRHEMQQLCELPAQRRRVRWRPTEPPGAHLGIDEVDELAPKLLGVRTRCERCARHFRGERAAQRVFLLDLPHRATDPVDVVGGDADRGALASRPSRSPCASKPSQCAKIRRSPVPARRARSSMHSSAGPSQLPMSAR